MSRALPIRAKVHWTWKEGRRSQHMTGPADLYDHNGQTCVSYIMPEEIPADAYRITAQVEIILTEGWLRLLPEDWGDGNILKGWKGEV